MSFEKIVDSKAYGFFDWLYRLVVINLLTILLILPVITILPAISACNATIRDHISGNNQNTIKLYFINFIRFLESSFILWILVVGLLLISGYSIYFYSGMSQENILSQAGFYVMIFMALIIAFMAVNIPLLIINFPKLPVRGLIKATFFVLGSLCRENSTILKDVFDKGHSIGIHTYTHEYGRIFKDEESFMGEIEMTVEILKNCLGDNFETRLFRFPGGCFEDYKRKYIGILNEKGYVYIDWNTLTGDSESLNPKPEHLMERFKETSEGKDQLIVLMHDSSAKGATVKVLPDVIEYLKSHGYEFAVLK
jgi:uncharacterized membrane protein YesL